MGDRGSAVTVRARIDGSAGDDDNPDRSPHRRRSGPQLAECSRRGAAGGRSGRRRQAAQRRRAAACRACRGERPAGALSRREHRGTLVVGSWCTRPRRSPPPGARCSRPPSRRLQPAVLHRARARDRQRAIAAFVEPLEAPGRSAMYPRIRIVEDESGSTHGVIEVRDRRGRTLRRVASEASGGPSNPLSERARLAKLGHCMSTGPAVRHGTCCVRRSGWWSD